MKNNNFRKNLIKGVCLGLTATLMLTGCNSDKKDNSSGGSKESNTNSASDNAISNTISAEYVYHECASFDIPEGYELNSQISISGDSLYVQATKYSENYDVLDSCIFVFDYSGKVKETIPFTLKENTSVATNIAVDGEGNMYYVAYEYIPETDENADTNVDDGDIAIEPRDDDSADDTVSTDEAVGMAMVAEDAVIDDNTVDENTDEPVEGDEFNGEDAYSEKYTLVKTDKTGKEVFSTDLSKYSEGAEYFYISNVRCGNDGNVYLQNDTSVIAIDGSGNELFSIDTSSNPDISYIENILITNENKIVASYYDNEWVSHICEIDSASKAFGKSYELSLLTSSNMSFLNGGGDYNLCYYDSNDMYGVNLETGESTKIINWIDSDINASNLQSASLLPDGKVIASYYDTISATTITSILEKSNPEDIKNQQVLTLAGNYLDSNIYSAVTKFNKENEDYRIKIIDYSSYSTEDDWNAGVTKFNADIALGNIPDIIMINSETPVESFVAKGVFADIGEMMDNDSEINRSDYLENVLEAFSTDGKLYSLAPSFHIETLTGKSSNFNEITEWDINKFIEYTNNLDEDTQILSDDNLTSDSLFYLLCYRSLDEFIDYSNKSCDFNNESFIKLLEFVKQYPTSEEYYEGMQDMTDEEYNDYYNEIYTKYRAGSIILQTSYFYDASSMYQIEMGDFGEDITFIGYPSSDGNGSYIGTQTELGISAKSENQEGAWQFMKYFLSDEYQESQWELPIKKSTLEKKFTEAMTPITYTDENGETVNEENIYYMNDIEYNIGYMDEAHKEKYIKFIESVNKKSSSNTSITDIISEETQAYFSGQKTAQEIAEIIQNRVNTYINETL